MKTLISMLLTLSFSILFAQEIPSKWRLGINFSPSLSYRHNTNKDAKDDSPGFGYDSKLHAQYAWKDHFSFESGIDFTYYNYRLVKKWYDAGFNNKFPIEKRNSYTSSFVGIPLKALYNSNKGKLRFIASASVLFAVQVGRKDQMTYTFIDASQQITLSKGFPEKYERFNLFPALSTGIEYNFRPGCYFRIEPSFQFRLKIPPMKDFPKTYPWNAGINFGCYFTLNTKA